MGVISYKPLIEDMTWSFSRVETFESCPYRWYLKYIRNCRDTDKFYASYGSFIHKIIERYYKGELEQNDMATEFLLGFSENVRGIRPNQAVVESYIDSGTEYLRNFKPFPFDMIAVEKRVDFEIEGIPFTGYIDFLGEKDGEFYIVDNKSRNLKPRSKRQKPTKNDIVLDEKLRQLYIYSAAVEQEYGKLPKALYFNCFKNGQFIEEPFSAEAYEEAKKWAVDTVRRIEDEEDFEANPEFFSCIYICGVSGKCDKTNYN